VSTLGTGIPLRASVLRIVLVTGESQLEDALEGQDTFCFSPALETLQGVSFSPADLRDLSAAE
jgi:hypothetical protein